MMYSRIWTEWFWLIHYTYKISWWEHFPEHIFSCTVWPYHHRLWDLHLKYDLDIYTCLLLAAVHHYHFKYKAWDVDILELPTAKNHHIAFCTIIFYIVFSTIIWTCRQQIWQAPGRWGKAANRTISSAYIRWLTNIAPIIQPTFKLLSLLLKSSI